VKGALESLGMVVKSAVWALTARC